MHSKLTRWTIGGAVALSLLGAAQFAQASSLTSAQIGAIIGLLQSFGADQNTINNVSAALNGQATTPSAAGNTKCVNLSHNLSVGSSDATTNGDVSTLQRFLALDPSIYPQGLVTGYFGSLTKQALSNWQAANMGSSAIGATTASYEGGRIGQLTRKALQGYCAQNTQTMTNSTITIDQSSLTTSASNPTITGSAVGITGVVEVQILTNVSNTIFTSGEASISNSKWSFASPKSLVSGTYTVHVYEPGSMPDSGTASATGTLTVMSY